MKGLFQYKTQGKIVISCATYPMFLRNSQIIQSLKTKNGFKNNVPANKAYCKCSALFAIFLKFI